jgi:arsenite methyltransferase
VTAVADAQFPAGIDAERPRDAVRDRYDAIGSTPDGGYSSRVGRDFAEAFGYPPELLFGIPSIATEAFTGVAIPMLGALDLGCGGLGLTLAARAVGPTERAISVDTAETMVERANATLCALGSGWAEAHVAYAEALPLAEATVDAVVANGILNPAPDKSAVLAEVARVLKPGGRSILAETTLRHELSPGSVSSLDDWFR